MANGLGYTMVSLKTDTSRPFFFREWNVRGIDSRALSIIQIFFVSRRAIASERLALGTIDHGSEMGKLLV